MRRLTIIDSFGFFFRLFYAMSSLKSADGKPSGMVSGFANFIASLNKELASNTKYDKEYLIFALDSGTKTFRSEILKDYKTNRSSPPDELKEQIPVCIKMIEKMGFCAIKYDGYEADDAIASAVKSHSGDTDLDIQIITHDKDLYQLISERVKIFSPSKKILYDIDGCKEKFGVRPDQIRDFLAICGDAADNIPGVKGIGDKGAKKLLDEFGNLDNIYQNLNSVANERTKKLLMDGKELAYISRDVARLYDSLKVPDLSLAQVDLGKLKERLNLIKDILEDYSLQKLLGSLNLAAQKTIPSGDGDNKLPFKAVLVLNESELNAALNSIKTAPKIAFDTETTGLDIRAGDEIVGFSFCADEKTAYYVPLAHKYEGAPAQISFEAAKRAVEEIFTHPIIGQNLKFDFAVIKKAFGIKPPKKYDDTMILSWLINSSGPHNMDYLAKKYLSYETIKFESLVNKKSHFGNASVELAARYASEDAWVTLRLYGVLNAKLDASMRAVYEDIELPFIAVLGAMEEQGIGLNRAKMQKLIEQNNKELTALNNEVMELCGANFNLNSPKQLGEILFERLNLPSAKKTKTGYSTDESVLASLINSHPAIAKIVQYRELNKLQGTYCEPLLELAKKSDNSVATDFGGLFKVATEMGSNGRIYSSFMQTGTATGRLSSKNPNLQNIPARGSLAKLVRAAFEASLNKSFISIDYSQIELRLLAHFSEDPSLLKAFENGEDIHERTAITLFGASSPANRQVAKSINFGLIYGMGANRLAQNLNIDKKLAKEHIERYFEAFGSVRSYLAKIKEQVKKDGYITTILGRRRYFDFNKANEKESAAFEREAVNAVFQGSAADIIKKAMVSLYYGSGGTGILGDKAQMILQIHDELIFEVSDDILDDFAKKAQNIMQNAVILNVPLIANVATAKNWGDLKS